MNTKIHAFYLTIIFILITIIYVARFHPIKNEIKSLDSSETCKSDETDTPAKNLYKLWGWDYKTVFTTPEAWDLIDAIENEDVHKIRALVKSGQADVNCRGVDNVTPLAWSLLSSDEVFHELLELGADPNVDMLNEWYKTFFLKTALDTKDYSVNLYTLTTLAPGTVLHNLLRPRFQRNIFEARYPGKPYHYDETRIREVLKHGANPNYRASVSAPTYLDYAVQGENITQKIKLLAEYGAAISELPRQYSGQENTLTKLLGDTMRAPNDDRFNALLFLMENDVDLRANFESSLNMIVAVLIMRYGYNLNAEYPQYQKLVEMIQAKGLNISRTFDEVGSGLLQRAPLVVGGYVTISDKEIRQYYKAKQNPDTESPAPQSMEGKTTELKNAGSGTIVTPTDTKAVNE